MNKIKQFKVGKTYECRSICDSDCIFIFKVLARTKKMVTLLEDGSMKPTTRKIYIYEGSECTRPHGSYSMASVLRAGKW